jgi:hypothetical protein
MTAWLPTIDANVATTNTGQNTGSARLKKISTANQYQKDYDDPSEAFNLWIGRVHLCHIAKTPPSARFSKLF